LKSKRCCCFSGSFDFFVFAGEAGWAPGLGVTANTFIPFLLTLTRLKEEEEELDLGARGGVGGVLYQQTP